MSSISGIAAAMKVQTITGIELFDGRTIDFDVMVFGGANSGPTLYVGATIHGDEVTGTEIVRRIVELVPEDSLSGKLIAVAVQNPLAFRSRSRFALSTAVGSIIDMYQVFPGNQGGEPAERMASILYREVLSEADYVLDLHSATSGSRNTAYAWVPAVGSDSIKSRSIELAKCMGMDFIMVDQLLQHGILHNCMATNGVPAITVELGEGGKIDEEFVEVGVRGIMNVLRELQMLDGEVSSYGKQIIIRSTVTVRANRGGLLRLETRLGEQVSQGDSIAAIVRPHDGVVEKVVSPSDGYIIKTISMPTVMSGERIAVVGTP
jgi:hypothetical protein